MLQAIQNELKAPKNQYNSFGKYKYRSCEDILEAVKPLLAKHNLYLTLSDEVIAVGNRVYVKATATITDGKESVSVTAFAREAENKKGMDDSQITGTASSYARKYALNGLFLIDDTKDADTNEHRAQGNTGASSKPELITDADIKTIRDCLEKNNVWEATLLEKGKLKALSELTKDRLPKVLEIIPTLR